MTPDDPTVTPDFHTDTPKRGMSPQLRGGIAAVIGAVVLGISLMWFFHDSDDDGLRDGMDCAPENQVIAHTIEEDEDCDGTLSADDCNPKDASDIKKHSVDGDCDGPY